MITFYNISPEDPYFRFKDKYDQALNKNQQLIEAIAISSYSSKTQEVDARFVNLKIIDGRDFIFFTNYLSPKALQFESHKQIAVSIYWQSINVQIRMKAEINKTSSTFNEKYFAERSLEKNALAISSKQSNIINSYENVKENYERSLNKNDLSKCPRYWGGYTFSPYYFEFWEGHKSRLNKRDVYELNGADWKNYILEP